MYSFVLGFKAILLVLGFIILVVYIFNYLLTLFYGIKTKHLVGSGWNTKVPFLTFFILKGKKKVMLEYIQTLIFTGEICIIWGNDINILLNFCFWSRLGNDFDSLYNILQEWLIFNFNRWKRTMGRNKINIVI